MSRRKLAISLVLWTLFVISILNVFSFSFSANAQATPTVYIDPPLTITNINATFSIDLDITAAQDVCSWQAYVYYKNDVLAAASFLEGPFLMLHGPTLFDGGINNNYNLTHGELWMYCLRTWSGYGVDGNGTLAKMTFRAKAGGTSPLSLANTVLGNSSAQGIDHTTAGGEVNVGAHDVSINSLTLSKTNVGQGYSMRINVTVGNQGNYPETFNVTSYANTSSIATQTVTLSNWSSTVATFTWNTSGFAKGNYTLSAYAWPVPGETNIQNNNLTSPVPVMIAMPGDVMSPFGVIDMRDIAYVARRFGTNPSSPLWDPNADITDDEKVDMKDIAIVARNFGKHDP